MAWRRNNALLIQQGSDGWETLLQLSAPIHMRYAQRHSFDYWCVCGTTTTPMPANKTESWCMIALMRQALAVGYSSVVFLGIDSLIVRPDYDLRQACPNDAMGLVWHTHPEGKWVFENEYDHWNVGVCCLGNGPICSAFVEEWWNSPETDHHWEQQHILNQLWQQRTVKSYMFDPIVGIDVRYNSTVGGLYSADAVVLSWHGQGEMQNRLQLMQEEIERREL